MFKICVYTTAILAALSASGCIPDSQKSLSDLTQATQDAKLHGLWLLTEGSGDVQYLHIAAEAEKGAFGGNTTPEPGAMRFWLVVHRAKTRSVNPPFGGMFFVTKIGDESYANVQLPFESDPEKAAKPTTYWFVKYKVTDTSLEMISCNWEATAKAIESGALKGIVTRDGQDLKTVQLTDSRENLVRYLSEGGAKAMFPEESKGVYQKLR